MSNCVYCNKKLDKIPKRKTKCPHCANYIYVKNTVLLTDNQKIISDAINNIDLPGIEEVDSLDGLWMLLDTAIFDYSRKRNYKKLSSIYLQMGILAFDEQKYKACIRFYFLCTHYSATKTYNSFKKYGGKLSDEELLSSDYMISSPAEQSMKKLGIKYNLGRLAISQEKTLDEKLDQLEKIIG